MPPPNGSATFVYGVGAVGYQNCTSCGARWRYLWQEPKASARRGNRRLVIVGALLVVAILAVVAAVALHSSPRKFGATQKGKTTASTKTTATGDTTGSSNTTLPTSTRPSEATTVPGATEPGPLATGADYVRIIGPIAGPKASFMDWLASSAQSTPQYEVNQRVTDFVKLARDSVKELSRETFAAPAAHDVDRLVVVYGNYLDDVDNLRYYAFLHSPSFAERLDTENQAVRAATMVVRRDLGLS